MNSPKVSFILPTYRDNYQFERCMDALLGQTLEDIEIIVMDNNPKRGSKFSKLINHKKVRRFVNYTKEYPVSVLFNEGVRHARSDIVCLQNDDDAAESFKAKLFWYFLKDSEFDAIITDFYTNTNGKIQPCRSIGYDYEIMRLGNYIAMQTIGWRKEVLDRFNTVAPYKQVWDYATLLYAGRAGVRFEKLDIPTETIFCHEGNMHRSFNGLKEKIGEYYELKKEFNDPDMAKLKLEHWERELEKVKRAIALSKMGEQVGKTRS